MVDQLELEKRNRNMNTSPTLACMYVVLFCFSGTCPAQRTFVYYPQKGKSGYIRVLHQSGHSRPSKKWLPTQTGNQVQWLCWTDWWIWHKCGTKGAAAGRIGWLNSRNVVWNHYASNQCKYSSEGSIVGEFGMRLAVWALENPPTKARKFVSYGMVYTQLHWYKHSVGRQVHSR